MSDKEVKEVSKHRSPTPIWWGILGVVVVAALGWFIFDLAATSSVPAGVDRAIDDYLAAWEARDAEAIRAVTAEGTAAFMLNEFLYEQGWDPDDPSALRFGHVDDTNVESIIAGSFPNYRFETERGDDVVVVGDGPWFVSFPETWIRYWEGDEEPTDRQVGVALYVVVEEDGVYRVANHAWSGLVKTIGVED